MLPLWQYPANDSHRTSNPTAQPSVAVIVHYFSIYCCNLPPHAGEACCLWCVWRAIAHACKGPFEKDVFFFFSLKMTTMMMIVMLSSVCFKLCYVQNGMVPFVLESLGRTCHSPTSLTHAPWVPKLHVKFHKRNWQGNERRKILRVDCFCVQFSSNRVSYVVFKHK